MFEWMADPAIWTALLMIVGIDIVLSGDNAVVIALACRSLPPAQQKKAIIIGAGGAIVLRTVLTAFTAMLLTQPWLKLIGSVLLIWIAIKLLVPEEEGDGVDDGNASMFVAIKTIIIADFVMSLDNVIGVAAAAKGNVTLLLVGLLISMPMIIYGSTIVMKMMARYPVLIALGAALLGYVAGDMGVSDPVVAGLITDNAEIWHLVVPILTAALVVVAGKLMAPKPAEVVVEVPLDKSDR